MNKRGVRKNQYRQFSGAKLTEKFMIDKIRLL